MCFALNIGVNSMKKEFNQASCRERLALRALVGSDLDQVGPEKAFSELVSVGKEGPGKPGKAQAGGLQQSSQVLGQWIPHFDCLPCPAQSLSP